MGNEDYFNQDRKKHGSINGKRAKETGDASQSYEPESRDQIDAHQRPYYADGTSNSHFRSGEDWAQDY